MRTKKKKGYGLCAKGGKTMKKFFLSFKKVAEVANYDVALCLELNAR